MNESNLLYVLLFSLLGSALSLVGGLILLKSRRSLESFIRLSVPFAAGALLAAVFLDIFVEALEVANANVVFTSALVGIVLFFVLERLTHWFHHHHDEDRHALKKSPLLIIVSDTIHNALDGIVIASAFLISVPTGIITTIAVAAHEIPQEIGDFGILLSKGVSRRKVMIINALSALSTTALALVTYILGDADKLPMGVLLGIGGGFLLYVALSDLIPTIHGKRSVKGAIDTSVLMLLSGIMIVGIAVNVSHGIIEKNHGECESHASEVQESDDEDCGHSHEE